jgi:hypothetical protein
MAIKRGYWIHDEHSFITIFILVLPRTEDITGHLGSSERYDLFLDSL